MATGEGNADGTTQAAPRECTRLNAAYGAMKAEAKRENYIAMLEGLEADLRENACAYLPVQTQADADALRRGEVKWVALESPKGRLLAVFTSREQASRKGAVGHALVGLSAFFRLLAENKEIAGFAVNPFDDGSGFVLDRGNLEVVLRRAQGASIPRLDMRVVSAACLKLFDGAVGVPTPVYEFDAELGSLGGPDGVLKPVLDKWKSAVETGAFRPDSPDVYVKTIVKDVMSSGFVAGALVRQGAEMVRMADPETCIARVPCLGEDLVQNTDEYLVQLSEILRARAGLRDDGLIWATLANNIGVVGYGAMCFGFGWGLAKCAESEGPEALKALKARQDAFRAKMRPAT